MEWVSNGFDELAGLGAATKHYEISKAKASCRRPVGSIGCVDVRRLLRVPFRLHGFILLIMIPILSFLVAICEILGTIESNSAPLASPWV